MINDKKSNKKSNNINYNIDEEDIFKSLSHKIRRNIIRIIGNNGEQNFTGIKNSLKEIDSPTLSYHLKSMQSLLRQKENKYFLSDIGNAAYFLLKKTDQSIDVSKYKRKLFNTYIITIFCWIGAEFAIPLILFSNLGFLIPILINIVIGIISVVNYVLISLLRRE